MKLGDSIKKALQSDAGSAISGGALDLYSGWINDDAGGGGGSSSSSITDEPWFWPAVAIVGLGAVYLVTKKR